MATAYRADITVSIRRSGRARARFVKSAIMPDVHKWAEGPRDDCCGKSVFLTQINVSNSEVR